MPGRIVLVAVMLAFGFADRALAQQTFTGRLSDSTCGASHQAHAGGMTERECVFACLKGLAKYVFVDQDNQVIPIANQDAMGLPLYAGRPVKLTGERKGDALFVTKAEAIPAHLHLGHVMTTWRDTPNAHGFLPVAVDEARVAAQQASLAMKAGNLEEMKLRAGDVLNALDPSLVPKGPGAGYGVKKALAGAAQHLDFAVKAEGASPFLTSHAAQVSTLLAGAGPLLERSVAGAQQIRAAADLAEAAGAAKDLAASTQQISDDLQSAKTQMDQVLNAEGLQAVAHSP